MGISGGVVQPALQEFGSWSGFGIIRRLEISWEWERNGICIPEEWNFVVTGFGRFAGGGRIRRAEVGW